MEPLETPPTSPLRPNRLSSVILASGAAVAMVLAGLGIASAQTDETPPTTAPVASSAAPSSDEKAVDDKGGDRCHKEGLTAAAAAIGISDDELRNQLRDGKTIAAVATEKGVAVEKVVAAMAEEAKTRTAKAVTDGKITQAQADERLAGLTERLTARVNRAKPADGEGGGRRHEARKAGLSAAAMALGLTEDELRAQLQDGKTIAAVASDKGVAVEKVIAAMVDEAKARLATAVTEGKLTQAQADKLTAELSDRITARVNRTGPEGGRHGRSDGRPDGAPGSDDDGVAPARFDA